MFDLGEMTAVAMIWLAFMSVVVYYVLRIGLMMAEQRIVERTYRMRLATLRGRSIREARMSAEG